MFSSSMLRIHVFQVGNKNGKYIQYGQHWEIAQRNPAYSQIHFWDTEEIVKIKNRAVDMHI